MTRRRRSKMGIAFIEESELTELQLKNKSMNITARITHKPQPIKFPKNMIIEGRKLKIIGGASFNIHPIKMKLKNEDFNSFLGVIGWLGANGGIASLNNIIIAFRSYVRFAYIDGITVETLSLFLDKCRSHKVGASFFGSIKQLFVKWNALDYPISEDVIDFLFLVKLPKPKRPSGSRVRSDDPAEGWYTDKEYDSLVQAIWRAYESGEDTLWRTCILLLSAQFGRRPIQFAHLKICDLKEHGISCGVFGRRIEFPGAKDADASEFRGSKIEVHPINNELWRLCQRQSKDTILRFEEALGHELTQDQQLNLPLFTHRSDNVLRKRIGEARFLHEDDENEMLASHVFHVTGNQVSSVIQTGPFGETVISHRTNEPLVQNAYRFRYTRARQIARSGCARAALQHWLGHETDFALDAYYDDPAERARVLNDQIAPLLAPLAQAFQGNLRDSEAQADRGDDPTSRIELDGQEEMGVGTCGEHGFCSASVPIPCYRCTKFQPWVFGPHHEVLDRLLERQRLENEVPRPGLKRRLLVPLQLDKDIQAVREVIALCEARKIYLGEIK
ncbi:MULTISPECIES: hypothetical protein [Aeromonas]|uniref:hypothetical protein n=2 Tax=Aeromonas TaxID=642 RepID=UPI00366BD986